MAKKRNHSRQRVRQINYNEFFIYQKTEKHSRMIHYDPEIRPNNHTIDGILKDGVPAGVSTVALGEKSDGVTSGVRETLSVDVFSMPILDSRMYVLSYDKQPTSGSKELLIVDPNYIPPEEVDNLKTICAGASSASVLFTHSHYDHIAGLELLRSLLPVQSYANSICNEKMQDSHKNLAAFSMALVLDKTEEMQKYCERHFNFNYRCEADEVYSFSASQEKNPNLIYGPDFIFGKFKIRTVYTPGHSDCSQCLELYCDVSEKMSSSYSHEHSVETADASQDFNNDSHTSASTAAVKSRFPVAVFTGDSLVNGHDTITRFPSGNKKIYKNITVPYLNSLDESTIVLPGHGEPARLASIIEFSNI